AAPDEDEPEPFAHQVLLAHLLRPGPVDVLVQPVVQLSWNPERHRRGGALGHSPCLGGAAPHEVARASLGLPATRTPRGARPGTRCGRVGWPYGGGACLPICRAAALMVRLCACLVVILLDDTMTCHSVLPGRARRGASGPAAVAPDDAPQ